MEQIDLKQSIYTMGYDRTLEKELESFKTYNVNVYRLLKKASISNLNYYDGIISFEVLRKTYLIAVESDEEAPMEKGSLMNLVRYLFGAYINKHHQVSDKKFFSVVALERSKGDLKVRLNQVDTELISVIKDGWVALGRTGPVLIAIGDDKEYMDHNEFN